MIRQEIKAEQKALEINLNDKIYGTFSEIGAGQEVARFFFMVGAAAGTIAKTMSAYDKVYSDKIYGVEESGRYVCESRLYKMLDHEYDLMNSRLRDERPDTSFFVFADTVSAINYSRTIKGNGWLGIRFQLDPDSKTNDIVLHVKMLDKSNILQQQAVGILGVNLIYACYNYYNEPEIFLQSLLDQLEGRVKVDMIRMAGPDLQHIDNRLLAMYLVKHGLTDIALFDSDKNTIHASEFLYRKNLLVIRGSYRPITLVNEDMLKSSFEQFRKDMEAHKGKCFMLAEITLDNLNKSADLDDKDFLDRADLLCSMGHTVMISSYPQRHRIVRYFSDFKVNQVGFCIGSREILDLINEKYYENLDGHLLTSFGELFTHQVKLYVYPVLQEGSGEMMTSKNMPIPDGIKHLYQHLLESGQIVDIEKANREILHIFSKDVLRLIQNDEKGWEEMVPDVVRDLIKSKSLFNYPCSRMEFEY